jgi:hypothetical protein
MRPASETRHSLRHGVRQSPVFAVSRLLDGFGHANIHSVLVVRHGRLLFEHTASNGSGDRPANAARGVPILFTTYPVTPKMNRATFNEPAAIVLP